MNRLSLGIIALLVLYVILLQECKTDPCVCPSIKDTVEIIKIDTVWPDKKPVTKIISKPKPKVIIPDDKDIIKVYEDSLVDDKVSILIRDTVSGEILNKSISYTLKVPLSIKETITKTIIQEKEVLKPVSGIFIGANIGINPKEYQFRTLSPEIEYISKKGYAYSYNYNLLQNTHSIGIKKKIF